MYVNFLRTAGTFHLVPNVRNFKLIRCLFIEYGYVFIISFDFKRTCLKAFHSLNDERGREITNITRGIRHG